MTWKPRPINPVLSQRSMAIRQSFLDQLAALEVTAQRGMEASEYWQRRIAIENEYSRLLHEQDDKYMAWLKQTDKSRQLALWEDVA